MTTFAVACAVKPSGRRAGQTGPAPADVAVSIGGAVRSTIRARHGVRAVNEEVH
ncbi:hypothetical protein [Saccharopolyspora gloriosae]|uniref:hypothetical protein n=1 Tax=Saccharopolyspora gloriosae TaxID=455344 RepID=UPI001FB72AB9|nr:hypothetical protein [Saccharopolyspora gloriosae]